MTAAKDKIPKAQQIPPEIIEKVQEYALAGAPLTDIALALTIPEKKLRRLCGKLIEKSNAQYRVALRTAQKNLANSSSHMAIHLGKNDLGQKDKVDHDLNLKGSWADWVKTAHKQKQATDGKNKKHK